jgi:HSP20 family protein
MDPIRKLRSGLERSVSRAWEGLTEGWREILTRGSGALTHFGHAAKQKRSENDTKDFPHWGLLASDCWETAQAAIVRIELPGVRKEDVTVSVTRGRLRLRGERRHFGNAERRHYHLMERAFGRFERSIPLPSNLDPARAEVSYQDGVVTVILQKTEVTPPIQLPVK